MSEKLIAEIVNILKEKSGKDIMILDMRKYMSIFDYMVICGATSKKHAQTLTNALKEKINVKHIEGYEIAEWILVDCTDIIVHIFSQEKREYYGLEYLWGDVPRKRVCE
ncbi:MAG: ribosome silencing factor [Deltaproteobacteria bacterium]|nr:ribosome silencing factor [Deltaproteobacteria bacterium]